MAKGNQAAAPNPVVTNLNNRHMLLAQGIPMRAKVGSFTGHSPGDTIRIKTLNTGVITSFDLVVSATVTQGATPAAYNSFAPYNLLSRVTFKDYNQTQRVNTDGYSLHFLHMTRAGKILDSDAESKIASSTAIRFNLTVPCAYDPATDLRGAVLAQTVVGEQYLELEIPAAVLGTDAFKNVFSSAGGASATISNIQVDVYQNYIQPNDLKTLPLLDLGTVYEIAGGYESGTDIATNSEKWINYPNVRNVLSAMFVGVDAGAAMTNSSFGQLEIWANSNAKLREFSYLDIRNMLSNQIVGYTLPDGVAYFGSRANPIATQMYGNVQIKANWGTITGGNTYTQSQYESFYPNGAPLPGIQTGG